MLKIDRALFAYFCFVTILTCQARQPQQYLAPGKTTIFIHGTVVPVVSSLMNLGKIPAGLMPFSACTNRYLRVGKTLIKSAPEQFPRKSFYYFGWSGKLDFLERKRAAKKLYNTIRRHDGPITLIAHSHGCNVALYLAHLAELKKDTNFHIDSLILLAPPVQNATIDYASSPVFKQIFSLYSTADFIQVADPQGIYPESKKVRNDQKLPLFSGRTFPQAPSLVQARILLDNHNPGHGDFIQPHFLRNLPTLITLLETAALNNMQHITLNIPLQAGPPVVKYPIALRKKLQRKIPHPSSHNTKNEGSWR